jgi:hypothetical protein
MCKRQALPQSYFVGLGDFGDFIFSDDPRYKYGKAEHKELARSDRVMVEIENIVRLLSPFRWLMVGSGNHEDKMLKRHFIDPAKEIAKGLSASYGGYSGFLRLNLCPERPNHARDKVVILYHHGAWTGKNNAGFTGVRDWVRNIEGYDICAYGHCHQSQVRVEPRTIPAAHGRIITKPRYYIATGCYLASQSQDSEPGYSEVLGYPMSICGSPLIKIVPHRRKTNISVVLDY